MSAVGDARKRAQEAASAQISGVGAPNSPDRGVGTSETANGPQNASEGVGTGAGEGAPRQDTASAWVTRSTDCPEAPAQAHPLAGRLSERQTVDALLACLPMHEDGTGHIADCGYDEDATPTCGCYSLPGRLAAIVREHTDRALAEVESRIDESIADLPEGREEWAHGAITALRNVQRHVRAARQEQDR